MEQTDIIRRKRKRKGLNIKLKISLPIIIILAFFLIYTAVKVLNNSIYPSMETLARAKVERQAVEAMNDAILLSLSSGETYAEILEATENGEKVYMLKANPIALNKLSFECAQEAQRRLSDLSKLGISVSLGTLTGIAPLSGKGPDIHIDFTPSATVKSGFSSSLQKSGINTTLYKVKIELTADIYIILPGKSSKVTVKTDACIAESVIVGEVPQVFTNVEDEDDMLNLVPTEIP